MTASLLVLFVSLAFAMAAFAVVWGKDLARVRREGTSVVPSAYHVLVGAITDFLDTLGIGSFATTTTLYRVRRVVPDELLPGTMNVGHTLPTAAQAFIYIALLDVDLTTLVVLVSSATLGGFVGAGAVARWSRTRVQLGMGLALLFAAALLGGRLAGALPEGGASLALAGPRLALGAAACAVFGALMTIGVGAYAPILVTVSLLGMNPTAAFPIMMGACAFLMPVASTRFVRARRYDPRASVGLAVGGVPAVLAAAFLVTSLPLEAVQGLVLVVVLVAAVRLLRDARRGA